MADIKIKSILATTLLLHIFLLLRNFSYITHSNLDIYIYKNVSFFSFFYPIKHQHGTSAWFRVTGESHSHTVWDSIGRQIVVRQLLPLISALDDFGQFSKSLAEFHHRLFHRFLDEVFIWIHTQKQLQKSYISESVIVHIAHLSLCVFMQICTYFIPHFLETD